jgi:hypothetical protein
MQWQQVQWRYVDDDPTALSEIKRRLEAAARGELSDLPRYAELVEGVWFHLPTVNDGRPFEMDWSTYTPLYSDILGHFLGYLSEQSYAEHGFMLSALAIAADRGQPSAPFFDWARQLGALHTRDAASEFEFWIDEVRRAQAYYAS